MKNIFLIGTFIFSLFVASCNKENVPDNLNVKGEKITISADIDRDAQTKLSYTDDATAKMFTMEWSANELFMVYRGANDAGEEFSNGNNGGSKFEGTAPEGTGEGKYYAVYGTGITKNLDTLKVDISKQIGDTTENGIMNFMLAESDELDSTTTFRFKHKLAILKLRLKLPLTDTIVNKVVISGMSNKASYTLSNSSYSYTNEKGDIIAINDTIGFAVKDSVITAYVAVFPEAVSEKSVTIKAVVGKDKYAYTMSNGKTLKEGTVIPVNVTLIRSFEKSDYYMWDAVDPINGTNPYYNDTTTSNATNSCKNCPTEAEIEDILGLDKGYFWDNNGPAYTLPDNKEYTAGLWLLRGAGKTPANSLEEARTSDNYIFLPACGFFDDSGSFNKAGTYGFYWLSTPNPSNTYNADGFTFDSGYAGVGYYYRNCGFVPMPSL